METNKREKLTQLVNRIVEKAVEVFKGEDGLTMQDVTDVMTHLPTALAESVPIFFVQEEHRQ